MKVINGFINVLNNGILKAMMAASLMLVACGNPSGKNEGMVFRYNETSGLTTLDPAFAKNQSIIWAVHQLFNTLVETDHGLNIVPSLAKSWEVSPDKKTYRFHLRTDVFFHAHPVFASGKGRRMVAADVVYSLRRIMDPAVASSGAWIFNNKLDAEKGFNAINDSTFELNLYRPFAPILGLLSMQYCSIVPREVVEKYGKDFRRNPCGTGPFRFRSWEEGQSLILARNEHYFEKDEQGNSLPYISAIKVSFFESKATEFLMFRQKQLDFINDIDASFRDEVLTKRGELRKEWKGRIMLSKHLYLNTEYLGILVDSTNPVVRSSPLRFKKVRQAINYGFDRNKMMLYLRNSIGIAANSGFVPAGLPSFDSTKVKGYHYDPAKALALLAEAGFPNGKGMPEVKLLTIPIYGDLAAYIARQLQEIGIPVKVEVIQKSLLLEQTATSKAAFFRASWIADYPEAENYLSVFYGKNPAPPNYTRYQNTAYDRLYEQSLQTENDSVRMDLYRKMDSMIIEDAPIVPLWYDEVIRLVQPGITGFEPNALNLLELRRVKTADR